MENAEGVFDRWESRKMEKRWIHVTVLCRDAGDDCQDNEIIVDDSGSGTEGGDGFGFGGDGGSESGDYSSGANSGAGFGEGDGYGSGAKTGSIDEGDGVGIIGEMPVPVRS